MSSDFSALDSADGIRILISHPGRGRNSHIPDRIITALYDFEINGKRIRNHDTLRLIKNYGLYDHGSLTDNGKELIGLVNSDEELMVHYRAQHGLNDHSEYSAQRNSDSNVSFDTYRFPVSGLSRVAKLVYYVMDTSDVGLSRLSIAETIRDYGCDFDVSMRIAQKGIEELSDVGLMELVILNEKRRSTLGKMRYMLVKKPIPVQDQESGSMLESDESDIIEPDVPENEPDEDGEYNGGDLWSRFEKEFGLGGRKIKDERNLFVYRRKSD